MPEKKNCPRCGTELPANAPAGVCPKCLLQAGIGDSIPEVSHAATAATLLSGSSNPDAEPSLPLTVQDSERNPSSIEPGAKLRYFGEYELLAEIARGGMGVVYRARQVRLNRIVALKMILSGQFAGKADVQRFHTEAEAAAQLDHPNIVPIYEVGEHDGHHFFTMGFVDGGSLASRLQDGPLAPRESAKLVRQIADAVQYAHEKGVIHRDLKPANILLDRNGIPRITDFGLAKNVQRDSGLTHTGQVMGTPGYLPPEQASGHNAQIRETADVYSLGAVLYALLTGRPPFQADNAMDTLMQVIERDPVSPRALNPGVPLDLETICLKCLEKDRRRRYQSAAEFSAELQRFLDGRPIAARPVSQLEHIWRWCRRNPIVAGLIATVAISLMVGIGVSSYFAVAATNRANENLLLAGKERAASMLANQRKSESDHNAELAEKRRVEADARKTEALANAELAENRRREAEENALFSRRLVYDAHMNLVQNAWENDQMAPVHNLLERHRPKNDGDEDLRGFEWYYWAGLCRRELTTIPGAGGFIVYSPDGTRIVSRSADFGAHDQPVRLSDATTAKTVATLAGHDIFVLAFSPDSRRIVTGCLDRTLKIWDAVTGQELHTLRGHEGWILGIAFSPDGLLFATASGDYTVKLWETETGLEKMTLTGHTNDVQSVAFSLDGTLLFTSSSDGTVRVWNAMTGLEQQTFPGFETIVHQVACSPDGLRIASWGFERALIVREIESGRELYSITGAIE